MGTEVLREQMAEKNKRDSVMEDKECSRGPIAKVMRKLSENKIWQRKQDLKGKNKEVPANRVYK